MTVTVYTKPACVQCTATTNALKSKGVEYTLVDLTKDPEAMARIQNLGYRQAPVVTVGDDHWSGFRPDKIAGLQ